jgi:DNA-binding XRE family transcriptional regulator
MDKFGDPSKILVYYNILLLQIGNKMISFPNSNGDPKRNVTEEYQELKDIIAHNLCYLRKMEKLSQKKLSEISGVSISTIKNIETRKENITIETIVKLTVALNRFYYLLVKEKIFGTVK